MSLLLAELARAYPAALLVGEQTAASATSLPDPPGARFVRTMPLGRLDRRPAPPYHQLLGSGLDARQFTDLSALDAGHLVTPTERFYVRSGAAPTLPVAATWSLTLGGLVRDEKAVTAEAAFSAVGLPRTSSTSRDPIPDTTSASRWRGIRSGARPQRRRGTT